ncbi:MAG: HU family DNA-binding protein [Bacteroidia bacterium]
MTKAELIKEVSQKTGIEKAITEATIHAFMKNVQEHVSNKNKVVLKGFGVFKVKKRAAKTARNIGKNKVMLLPECYIPAFKPSKMFVDMVKRIKVSDAIKA